MSFIFYIFLWAKCPSKPHCLHGLVCTNRWHQVLPVIVHHRTVTDSMARHEHITFYRKSKYSVTNCKGLRNRCHYLQHRELNIVVGKSKLPISSSLAHFSPLLDIGLSKFLPSRSIFGYSDPAPASSASQIYSPSGLRASYTTFI
jgi:hypothetical protein